MNSLQEGEQTSTPEREHGGQTLDGYHVYGELVYYIFYLCCQDVFKVIGTQYQATLLRFSITCEL